MNFGDRLQKQGGLAISHSNGETPCFGKIWFVDTTNGSATGDGDNPSEALSTIQLAITAQGAAPSGLGDIIYVLPGNYAEDLTGNLTKAQLIGATCGGTPEVVSIRPVAGSAYTGILENAGIRNLDFRQSSTNPEQAVLEFTDLLSSIIDNCAIIGGTDDAASCGILIGSDTEAANELMFNSGIKNCLFTTFGARTTESFVGIMIGNGSTNNATRKFSNSYINHNRMFCESRGINIDIADGNGVGSEIAWNTIGSNQSSGAVDIGINSERTNNDIHVHDNRIVFSSATMVNRFTHKNANFGVHGGTASIENWYE